MPSDEKAFASFPYNLLRYDLELFQSVTNTEGHPNVPSITLRFEVWVLLWILRLAEYQRVPVLCQWQLL